MENQDHVREITNLRSTVIDLKNEIEKINLRHSELIESKIVVINELQGELESLGALLASKDKEIASLKQSAGSCQELGTQDGSELSTLRSAYAANYEYRCVGRKGERTIQRTRIWTRGRRGTVRGSHRRGRGDWRGGNPNLILRCLGWPPSWSQR